jgi:hypothetical protein
VPTPPTALHIIALTAGRCEATCGRCLKHSIPIPAVSKENAWVDLQRLGWTWFVSEYGGAGYCICAKCTKEGPPEVLKRGVRKRKSR